MERENPENPENAGMGEAGDVHKNELITTDDGLDQAIQRAIAQHDLEQQQLEQQNQNQNQNQNQLEAGTPMDGSHELTAVENGVVHVPVGANNDDEEAAANLNVADMDVSGLGESPLLDAAQEKQHLQMIADELNRAATDHSVQEPESQNQNQDQNQNQNQNHGNEGEEIKAEDPEFVSSLSASVETGNAPAAVVEIVDDAGAADGAGAAATEAPGTPAANSSSQNVGVTSTSAAPSHAVSPEQETGADQESQASFQQQEQQQQQKQASPQQERVLEHAHHIPANSELLATNSAVAAYNALSSQSPPTASLANAHLAALPLPIIPTNYMPARIQLLVSTLAVLDNLATQLLRVFAIGPYQKIIDLASSPETAPGAAFRDLTSLFEFTKRLYSEEDPFLTVEHIAPGIWKEGEKTPSMFRSREQTIESTLRKVNLATFLAATLGTIEVGFFHLNESFLNVFCPANDLDPANSMSNMNANNMNLQSGAGYNIGERVGKILKPQASLYLDLKTQAYISAIEAGERSNEEILEDILPSNLEQILQERRCTKILSPTEMDFINRCNSRKETLLAYPPDHSLNEEYEWFEFLKDLFEFVSKNMGFLLWGKKGKVAPAKSNRGHISSMSTPAPMAEMSNTPHSDEILQEMNERPHQEPARAQRGEGKGLDDLTAALLPSEIQEQQIHLRINPGMSTKGPNRRPWTRQEEKALRHAMELKGTQWSVILELFGQGGRINESLKNRTQVQLKDKARNWKMFFLKSGLAVPHYLQKVTGDLDREDKSRAKSARNKKTAAAPVPTVAAKRDGPTAENATGNIDDELRKKRRVE